MAKFNKGDIVVLTGMTATLSYIKRLATSLGIHAPEGVPAFLFHEAPDSYIGGIFKVLGSRLNPDGQEVFALETPEISQVFLEGDLKLFEGFKVGQTLRVVGTAATPKREDGRYDSAISPEANLYHWAAHMTSLVGQEVTVRHLHSDGAVRADHDASGRSWAYLPEWVRIIKEPVEAASVPAQEKASSERVDVDLIPGKYIIGSINNGKPGMSVAKRPVQHDTLHQAMQEAERLIDTVGVEGSEFVVLHVYGVVSKAPALQKAS